MGFRFRKSIGKGPFRVNVSKSGIGYSVGTKGLRYTKKAGGGTRTTASIPGTGISYSKDSRKAPKKTAERNAVPQYQKNRPENTAVADSGNGFFAGVAIIRLMLIAFMGWAFCGIFPQLRSIWIALAVLLTVPIPIFQTWITKTFQINAREKVVFGLVFFLFGGLVHNNFIHAVVIAGLAIAYVFLFKRLKALGENGENNTSDGIEPQMQRSSGLQPEQQSPENRGSKYTKALLLIVLVPVLLLSSCSGSNAPETEGTAPAVPETTIAAIETTEPAAEETVVETTATVTEPTETVVETTQPVTETTQAATQDTEPEEEMVWIPTGGGKKYHSYSGCSNMNNPQNVTISKAKARGFTPCKRCY